MIKVSVLVITSFVSETPFVIDLRNITTITATQYLVQFIRVGRILLDQLK